ncbi:sigma-70 family RNA polymerase sigma factor [Nocardia farcinica]|uniref:sigma-70 family RNA polymerase sigma factor n=1 Tax=Nocardia farcinica TaxID=37329 RepID=UPI001E5F5309|nr:sigma-70 family RNA polymerase sigma factor [Nocardia farcinica]
MDTATVARFEASRNRLASLAYRLLGSAADAEDTVQDAFLRWQAADPDHIEVPEAWLTKIVTNLALDRLRSARVRRERAVGTWMPEPLLDGDPMLGPADTVEQRESVTLAVLMLMERLSPIERAVYVLREAFSYSHAEIAGILDITEAASQQHAHRARRRLAAERTPRVIEPASARRIVEAFVAAAASGPTDRLVALLTDDATGVSDGALGRARTLIRFSGRSPCGSPTRSARGSARPRPSDASSAVPSRCMPRWSTAARPCCSWRRTGSWVPPSWRFATAGSPGCAGSRPRRGSTGSAGNGIGVSIRTR